MMEWRLLSITDKHSMHSMHSIFQPFVPHEISILIETRHAAPANLILKRAKKTENILLQPRP
jgi:hypothetical protein